MAGEPNWVEGTGEPRRAMLSERVACDSAGETLPSSRDDDGTACGVDDSGCLLAMLRLVCRRGNFGYLSLSSAMPAEGKITCEPVFA
jgi:hypothetical protein